MHCDLEIEQGSLFSVFQKCQNDYFVLFVNKHFLFVNKHFLFVTRETCEMPCDSQGILESIWSGFESPLGTPNLRQSHSNSVPKSASICAQIYIFLGLSPIRCNSNSGARLKPVWSHIT